MRTIGDLFDAVVSVRTAEEARAFMESYRAENPHADANVGYVIGYADEDTRRRLYDLFRLVHPVFGVAV